MIGLIGRKLGMTRIFDAKGLVIPVTVIELGPNQITNLRKSDGNGGYTATCLGFEQKRDKLVTMPRRGTIPSSASPLRASSARSAECSWKENASATR